MADSLTPPSRSALDRPDEADRPWYLVSQDERLAWTEEGRRVVGPHLARAGIRLDEVRTLSDYRAAMRAASPYLRDSMMAIAERHRDKPLEYRALTAILTDDPDAWERAVRQLRTRSRLRVC